MAAGSGGESSWLKLGAPRPNEVRRQMRGLCGRPHTRRSVWLTLGRSVFAVLRTE
jgi:hypothetical protein